MASPIPSAAKLRETRLAIKSRTDDIRRPTNLKSLRPSPYGEQWQAEFLFANMTRADTLAVVSFFEALDGPVTPFSVPLAAGYATRAVTTTAALASVPPRGASEVRISVSPAVTVRAGTLIAFGNVADADYQMCEILEDAVPVGGVLTLAIAPRVRWLWPLAEPVTIGAVSGKFRLLADGLGAEHGISSGIVTIKAQEAI